MTWTVFIDGGARGNPGPAGAGIHILDQHGQTVLDAGFFLGRTTNNQAEYTALLKALELLQKTGAEAVAISSDSELLVRQIKGEYRVKSSDLQPLHRQAQHLLAGLARWDIRHIRREQNSEADALVNRALDARRDVVLTDRLHILTQRGDVTERAAAPSENKPGAGPCVEVVVRRGPGTSNCPARIKQGQTFEFGETVPAGLCLEGCAAILEGVLALRELPANQSAEASMTCRCTKAGCRSVFELRVRDQ